MSGHGDRGSNLELIPLGRRGVAFWGERSNRVWRWMRRPLVRASRDFHAAMLYQDVRLGMNPSYSSGREYNVVLAQGDETLRPLIANALGTRRSRGDLDDAVASWLEDAASSMIATGSTAYEIEFLAETEHGPATAFRLMLIRPASHFRLLRRDWQYVPGDADAGERSRLILLDRNRVVRAALTRRKMRGLRRMYAVFDSLAGRSAAMVELTRRAYQGLPYDFDTHRKYAAISLASATSVVGWDARGLLRDHQLEPYVIWRFLEFQLFKVDLRAVLIDALNDALTVVGAELGWTAQLEVRGMPDRDAVLAAKRNLADGAGSLDDIVQRFIR